MEKERKKISCSYAVLVIILFATLAFVVDYAIIERKMNKCNCPKCEVTTNNEEKDEPITNNEKSNEQVNENNDNIDSFDNFSGISCIEKSDELCLLKNYSYKISIRYDKTNERYILVVNDKDVNLNFSVDGAGEIKYLPDNYMFINYDVRSYAIVDPNANVIINFNDYDEGNFIVDTVSYKDNKFIMKKTNNTMGAAYACKNGFSEDDVMNLYYYYEYVGNGKIGNLLEKKEVTLRQYIKAETGLNSCSEYLNR